MKVNAAIEENKLKQKYEDNYAAELSKILYTLNGIETEEAIARLKIVLEGLGDADLGSRTVAERNLLYDQLVILAEKSKNSYGTELTRMSEQMVNIFKALNMQTA